MIELLIRLLGTAFLAAMTVGATLFVFFSPEDETEAETPVRNAPIEAPNQTTSSSNAPERGDAYFAPILNRPVFEITRRPIENQESVPLPVSKPVPKAPPPEAELPQVRLMGVMSAGSRVQVLISVAEQEPIWLTEGEKVSGWTIAEAGEDWLVLAAKEKTIRLELFE